MSHLDDAVKSLNESWAASRKHPYHAKSKKLSRVWNTLKTETETPLIKKMKDRIETKIDQIDFDYWGNHIIDQPWLTNKNCRWNDSTVPYKVKPYFKDYNDDNCKTQDVHMYEFVRGKLRKDFPELLKEITKDAIDYLDNPDFYIAKEHPKDSNYWARCRCISGEDPYENLDNCRAHYVKEYGVDKDPVDWWRKESSLSRKIKVWRKDLKK